MIAALEHRHHSADAGRTPGGNALFAILSASIVHEISQPMAAIAANAGACRNWLAAERPDYVRVAAIVERICENAAAVTDILDALRALHMRQDGARRPAQVNDIIREVRTSLTAEAMRRGVEIRLDLDLAITPLDLQPVQIRQLLVNLIRNGAEAMATRPGSRPILVRSTRYRGGARIDVIDRGTGCVDADRMFDAFFTTKPKGMGVGLALSRLILDAHGGELWTEPAEPCGTCMSFILPGQRPREARLSDDRG